MARCLTHEIEFDPKKAEFCVYCGDPKTKAHTLKHCAKEAGVSLNTAREWFKDEPGVIKITHKPYNPRKETRTHLRVPQGVLERVLHRKQAV